MRLLGFYSKQIVAYQLSLSSNRISSQLLLIFYSCLGLNEGTSQRLAFSQNFSSIQSRHQVRNFSYSAPEAWWVWSIVALDCRCLRQGCWNVYHGLWFLLSEVCFVQTRSISRFSISKIYLQKSLLSHYRFRLLLFNLSPKSVSFFSSIIKVTINLISQNCNSYIFPFDLSIDF